MKKLEFSKTLFLRSVVNSEDYPVLHKGKEKVPEVALVGRSNVGKSSLINHLTQLKSLAKTSSVPGKTQTINFYLTDNNLCLVDLPGYGFSKVSHTIKHTWSDSLEQYLQNRQELKLILVLIDFRRNLSNEDKDFIEWASSQEKDLFFIFTKADKLSGDEKKRALKDLLSELAQIYPKTPINYMTYSVKEMDCRIKLRETLQQITN
jgi:GTP-binding protein